MSDWVKVRQCWHGDEKITEVPVWVNMNRVTHMLRCEVKEPGQSYTVLNGTGAGVYLYCWDTPEEILAQRVLAPSVRRVREGEDDPMAGTREMINRRGGMISG